MESNEITITAWLDKLQLLHLKYDGNSLVERFYTLLNKLDVAINQKVKDIFQIIDFTGLESEFKALLLDVNLDHYNEHIDGINNKINEYMSTLDQRKLMMLKRKY
jgi:hypothetical protein